MTNFCLGNEYLLQTKFFADGFFTDKVNLINFRGIKSGSVAFLGFLSLKGYLTIKATTQDNKRRVRRLLGSKDAQARKAHINDG